MSTGRKRRKLSTTSYRYTTTNDEDKRNKECDEEVTVVQSLQCHTLETLPPEVLGMILSLLPFADVAGTIRLVSRRCSTIATTVLNGAFLAAGARLETTLSYIDTTKSRATTDTDLFVWSRAFNVLELIKSQYKMLKAVTWRYTHPPKATNFNRVCFYAGTLLDELNDILNIAKIQPRALSVSSSSSSSSSSYQDTMTATTAASSRLISFVALCKRFMDYFEKVSESKYNRSALISGCKAVDVLDCLAVGREVTGFRVSSIRARSKRSSATTRECDADDGESRSSDKNVGLVEDCESIVTMRLRYVMRRAWFTCLQVPCAEDENSWREDQRFMYLRLRRLVGSVNEHHYERIHYERDLQLRSSRLLPQDQGRRGEGHRVAMRRPAPPTAATYSGYGVYAGRFFYYGNMNKYAYESKFKDLIDVNGDDSSDNDDDDDDVDDDGIMYDQDDSERRSDSVASRRGPPAFDLIVRVELRCSSELAPLAVHSSLRKSEMDEQASLPVNVMTHEHPDNRSNANYSPDNAELYYKLSVTCAASAANRLPSNFIWEQRAPSHSRHKRRKLRFSQ